MYRIRKYYINNSDFIFCEENGIFYNYNYVNKEFVPCKIIIDPMNFHEFNESELEEMIKLNEYLYIK